MSTQRTDTSSPEYRAKLRTSLRWDPEREEPYLQLPSFPHLRLVPFREGIEDDLVGGSHSSNPALRTIRDAGRKREERTREREDSADADFRALAR